MKESIFNEMSQFVQFPVISSLYFSILFGQNNNLRALFPYLFNNSIAVITAISQQIISVDSFNQAVSLCAISSGILCDKDSDRHTLRIHGQMYFGVKSLFVRLIS